MWTVELKLDETLARFEVQNWIDKVLSVQFPDIEAKIKSGCQGCNDSLKEIAKWKKGQEILEQRMYNILEEAEKFEKENKQLKAQIEKMKQDVSDMKYFTSFDTVTKACKELLSKWEVAE